MFLKKIITVSLFLFVIFFISVPKSFAKTNHKRYTSLKSSKNVSRSRNSLKIGSRSKMTKKSLTKKNKKELLYTQKIINNFSVTIPTAWQCIEDSTQLPENVVAVFIPKSQSDSTSLTPTINIATEVTPLHQEEYVCEALKYHSSQDGNLRSYIFDILKTPSGESCYIVRSERTTQQFGEISFVQGIFINKNTAYVITGSTPKEQIGSLFPIFLKTISSLDWITQAQ